MIFSVGKTYRLRISNVGLQNSLNFRIQNHTMKLVEVEGRYTIQNLFSSLDVHVGQSYSVLITADQPAKDYYVVVSSRFTSKILTTTGVLHYSNSVAPVSGPIPDGPIKLSWSFNQARAIRYCFILQFSDNYHFCIYICISSVLVVGENYFKILKVMGFEAVHLLV